MHIEVYILTVHFQNKSNPIRLSTYKHFGSAVILGLDGLAKPNKHCKE